MEPRKVIMCTFLFICHLQLITSFKVPYQPNHQDNAGYNSKAQKSENNEYNWEDEADRVDTLNGGTAIPMNPGTNWMTPVPWSPNRNEEKHESLGTEESKNSEDTGSGEEIWSETEEESENSEETGSAETDWWSETEEESENSEEHSPEETGSAETDWWSETEEESENSEETGSAETYWWSETEKESENSEEKDTKKNWWSSWNHGKDQEKQHIKSDQWHQNDMESSETRDSSDSQEEADMGEFAKLAKGLFGSAGAFGGLNAEVESMEVNMSGLRMETGFAASGNGGQSNITEKMNVNQMAVAPPRNTEGGIVSSLNFAIDKIEMKLNGLKIGMGGGEGMQGATPSNMHEVMMKSHFRHMGSENGEDYY